MAQKQESIQEELAQRHRSAVIILGAMLGLTAGLVVASFIAVDALYRPADPSIPMALFITILIFALGSFVLRRTRFQTMRLKDIAALRGTSGLLATLQRTTVQIAFIGGAISLMGFLAMMMTHDPYHMLRAGGVAAIVLVSAYPQKSSWQRLVKSMEQPVEAEDAESAKGIVA